MDLIASLIVSLLCGAFSFIVLQFLRDAEERKFLTRLFFIAFLLRLAFTYLCYQTGLVNYLGGADDTAWVTFWSRSRRWEANGVESFLALFDRAALPKNQGFNYLGSVFFYLLKIRSQEALACFHCFLNAMTAVVIFKVAREFCSRKASAFVSWVAAFMPGFLIWSALTIKEAWLILLEISILFLVVRFNRQRDSMRLPHYLLFAFILLAVVLTLRYYVALFLCASILMTLFCYRAPRPFLRAILGSAILFVLAILLNGLGIIHTDPVSIAQSQVSDLTQYRDAIADPRFGGTSSIRLGYDTTTALGLLKMLGVGSLYLLLSPFPWEIFRGRQIFSLPDVALWWYLVFIFIVPGIRYGWKQRPHLFITIFSFTMPLIVFYSLIFGNVGLAYRQRAQLMPFLLILVAVEYDRRRRNELTINRKRKAVLPLLHLYLESHEARPEELSTEPTTSELSGGLPTRT